MDDLISRKALLDDMKKELANAVKEDLQKYEYMVIMTIALSLKGFVERQLSVEAVPVVHSKWIPDKRGIYFCDECDSEAYWDTDYGQQLFDYCPYCGADMRKKVQE